MIMTCENYSSVEDCGSLILVENAKRDLTWTVNCGDKKCALCKTLTGNTIIVPDYVNSIVFKSNTKERLKVVARIGVIE